VCYEVCTYLSIEAHREEHIRYVSEKFLLFTNLITCFTFLCRRGEKTFDDWIRRPLDFELEEDVANEEDSHSSQPEVENGMDDDEFSIDQEFRAGDEENEYE
jgi:hypothetical protein